MKKSSLLFALLCVSVMGWATQYCEKTITAVDGVHTASFTCKQTGTDTYVVEITSTDATDITGFNAAPLWMHINGSETYQVGANFIQDGNTVRATVTSSSAPDFYTSDFYFYYPGEVHFQLPIGDIDFTATCTGTPLADPALSLNETAVTLDATVPETFQIVPTQSGDGAISYESSNTAIATVSNTGLVTAVGRGTATITVRTAETATYAADSETLEVTVNGPINWAALGWIGNGSGDAANTDKWKMAEHGYVNIQTPGFASEASIYAEFAAPIVYCSLGEGNYDIQGAGLCMHLSAFTAEVTEVLVIGNHIQSIFYVYKDGASGTANLNDIVPTNIYDTNLALETNGGWASATSGTAWQANDGNSGSSWESTHGVDAQMWTLDLGQRRIFNTIQLRWEGAYGKAFTIDVSNDGSAWTTVKSVNETLSGPFPYEQTLEFAEQTARFVRFNGIERGTQWGYNLFEFRVLLPGVSVLTSIDLSAAGAIAEVGGAGVALTAQPKDQNGQDMAETVSYEITPAAAGHMSGNTYIPDQVGTASIRAYNGTVFSNAITIAAYIGTNLAFEKDVTASSYDETDNLYPSFAVDNNEGSLWSARVGETGAEREYDAWLTVDLGNFYDINLVAIKWQGACSKHYKVEFSTNGTDDWRVAYNAGWNAIEDHWEYLVGTGEDNTKVHYVRVFSTEAVSQYGIKIMDLKVFGVDWVDTGDTEAPVMTSASLVSKTWNSAVIAVAATDNVEVVRYHVVDATNNIDALLVANDGKITITGLTAETAYNFTITAKDAANLESTGIAVPVTTNVHHLVPTTAAPVPTWPADQVKSLYSDTYTFAPESLVGYNQDWWNNPNMTEEAISENHYLHYDLYRNGMIGVQFADMSVATMEKIHIDIYASDAGSVRFRPITDGGPGDAVYKELVLNAEQWNSFDIPMTDFPGHNWTKLYQYAIQGFAEGGMVGTHISVDNVFFYRETPYVDTETPTGVSATLLSTNYISARLQVSAADNSGAVSFVVKNGDDVVANGGGASGATVIIDVPNLAPGTAYNLSVIAKDDANNAADPVAVAATTTALPDAASVPTHEALAVKSLYSDTYAPAADLSTTNQDWWYAPTSAEITFPNGNKALYYYNIHEGNSVFGWAFGVLNASNFQKLHISIYPANAGTIEVYPVIAPEDQFHKTSQTLVAGEWNELVFDYTDKTFADMTQLGFIIPDALGSCIIDNVYFYKDPEYTRDDSWMAPGELGTVCYPEGLRVAGATMYQMMGTDANGKFVFDEVTELEPGVPYLFEATADVIHFYATEATPATDAGESNGMKGTFTEITIPQASPNIYYFSGQKFYAVTARQTDLTVPANRAYVDLTEPHPAMAPKPGIRRITFDVEGTSTITGCEQIDTTDAPAKILIDGNLYILRGEKLYDATGRLVK